MYRGNHSEDRFIVHLKRSTLKRAMTFDEAVALVLPESCYELNPLANASNLQPAIQAIPSTHPPSAPPTSAAGVCILQAYR
jgi:hypothetical protein